MRQVVCFSCRKSLDKRNRFRILTMACEECFNSLVSSPDEKLEAYLEALKVPAALLSQNLTVLLANTNFRKAVGHDSIGLRGGEALDCMYTAVLGRCGETVACMLCSLKRSVEHAWSSGKGLRDVQMSFPHKVEVRKTFSITTEKVGRAVLVLMAAP